MNYGSDEFKNDGFEYVVQSDDGQAFAGTLSSIHQAKMKAASMSGAYEKPFFIWKKVAVAQPVITTKVMVSEIR